MSAEPVRIAAPARGAFFTPKTLAAYLALSERTVRAMLADGVNPVLPDRRVASRRAG